MNELLNLLRYIPRPGRWLIAIFALSGAAYALSRLLGLKSPYSWISPLVVLVFCGLFALIEVLRKGRDKKRSRDFEAALGLNFRRSEVGKEEVREALAELSAKWQGSIAQLREAGMSIYSLPWFLLIGEPQSGKSTTLVNSGLEFPVGAEALSDIGGTRNCDWWFSNEAVILDTAGRFTFQEESAPDQQEWSAFLKLLRKQRKLCPINGVIVAIPATSLVEDLPDEQKKKAKNIRQKLLHLQKDLAIRFPVFILITKADRVLGFTEFFSKLDPVDERQLFGWSNPDAPEEAWDLKSFSAIFDDMVDRLHKLRMRLLKNEGNLSLLDRFFVFPEEMQELKEPLANYFQTIFPVTRFEEPFLFRGFYLTSGVQQGRPIARACRDLLRVQVGDPQGVLEDLKQVFPRSRAFFIRDFYEKKVFPERGLIARTRAALKKDSLYRRGLFVLSSVVGVAMVLILLFSSFHLWTVLGPIRQIGAQISLCTQRDQSKTCDPEVAYGLIQELEQERERVREANWTLLLFLRSAAQNEVSEELIPEIQARLFRRNILEPVLYSFEERAQGLDWRHLHEGSFENFYAGLQQLLRFMRLRGSATSREIETIDNGLRISPLLAFCKATPGRDPGGRAIDEWLKTGINLPQIDTIFEEELASRRSAFNGLAVPEPVQSYAAFRDYWASQKLAEGNIPSYKALSEAALEPIGIAAGPSRVIGARKMNNLFEIASRVSTPLALSGLVAASLFLIFRQIVARDIFPQLTKSVSGKIFGQIIDRLFILALVAVVLGFFGFLLAKRDSPSAQSNPAAPYLNEAPTPVSPADGVVLTNSPRILQLSWSELSWAQSYAVEVEIQGPFNSDWHPYPLEREKRVVRALSISFEFTGGTSGRWRVSPIGADGKPGRSSSWSHFVYEGEQRAVAGTESGEPVQKPIIDVENSGNKKAPNAPTAEERKVLSRERTAGEVLAVLDEAPIWDRERSFNDHFKGRWPPRPGWSGTVEGDPRANDAGGCDLLVVERGTRARIMAHGPAKACDARNRDRVTVAGPIVKFDASLLTIRCVEVSIE